ncbi:MAG: YceI family protein [Aromatoleum sp.]|nr:YceI family protein [Aromatoleum sp.]
MSKILAALVLAATPVVATAAAESYTLDPYYPISFSGDHLDMATVYGHFSKISGKITIDRLARTGAVDITVETASVDTGDADKGGRARSRDEHLRSADFFNAAEFPTMTYKATNVFFSADAPALIDGNLTLLGVTRPVKLTIQRFKCVPASGTTRERCGGNATGKLKRSDFGMKYGIPAIGDEITLLVGFEATKD